MGWDAPPGTPPPMTPATDAQASSSAVCSGGSMGTPAAVPISRILARISCGAQSASVSATSDFRSLEKGAHLGQFMCLCERLDDLQLVGRDIWVCEPLRRRVRRVSDIGKGR